MFKETNFNDRATYIDEMWVGLKEQIGELLVKMEAEVNMLQLLTQLQKELQLDLKTNSTQNCQNINGSLTIKDLKKPYLPRWVGGMEMWRWVERCGDVVWCREIVKVDGWSPIHVWWINMGGVPWEQEIPALGLLYNPGFYNQEDKSL